LLVTKERRYLESDVFDLLLRSRRHAILDDLGVVDIGHGELVELVSL